MRTSRPSFDVGVLGAALMGAPSRWLLQPGSGITYACGPQRSMSLLVELGEFVLVVDGDRAVVVDHRAAGRGDVRQDLDVHLAAGAAQFAQAGIQLELLTGPLTGIYDPTGMGSMVFAVLADVAVHDDDADACDLEPAGSEPQAPVVATASVPDLE